MEKQVREHYHSNRLAERISNALKNKNDHLSLKDLAPIDQLHTGGAKATRSVFELANIGTGLDVLDAGCGLGGSSRLMARDLAHRVTGIDLSSQFIEVAQWLTQRCSLSDRIEFKCGSILEMPFNDESFDVILCQHVLMNIEDKQQAFNEFSRVLKNNGVLLFHEIVKGEHAPLMFPVPWAGNEAVSFLKSREDLEAMAGGSGFKAVKSEYRTEEAAEWWARVKQKAGTVSADENRLGPHLIFGTAAAEFGKTMSFNIEQHCIRVMKAVFVKAQVP